MGKRARSEAVPPQNDGSEADLATAMYADASDSTSDYPTGMLPQQRRVNRLRLTAEEHWQVICKELTSHSSLSQAFLD